MTCRFMRSNITIDNVGADGVDDAIKQILNNGGTCFFVEKASDDSLTVIYTERGCIVLYTHAGPDHYVLDASRSSEESSGKVRIRVDHEPTVFPANMKLGKRIARQIITEFCRTGELTNQVHWIRERAAASSAKPSVP